MKIHIAIGVGQHRQVAGFDAANAAIGLTGHIGMRELAESAGEIACHIDLPSAGRGLVGLGLFLLGGNSKICRPSYKQADRRQSYYSFHFFSSYPQ